MKGQRRRKGRYMGRLIFLLFVTIFTVMLAFGRNDGDRVASGTDATPIVEQAEVLDQVTPDMQHAINALIVEVNADAGQPLPLTDVVPTTGDRSHAAEGSIPPLLVVVTGSDVNLRSGPALTASVVARMQNGDKAELIAEPEQGWLLIRDPRSGLTGYMASAFLTLDDPD